MISEHISDDTLPIFGHLKNFTILEKWVLGVDDLEHNLIIWALRVKTFLRQTQIMKDSFGYILAPHEKYSLRLQPSNARNMAPLQH